VQLKNKEINFSEIKIEFIIPLFAGVLCSLFLCVLAGNLSIFKKTPEEPVFSESVEERFESLFLQNKDTKDTKDIILECFSNSEYRDWVVNFFTEICSDINVSQAILDNCEKFEVSPALAFALCWEESKFNAQAINRHNRDGSIDRGLFQLNSRSFPNLETIAFFDINTNAYYGISHLRYCLDTGGNDVSALAMYNAGTGRVKSVGAPAVTLNYISRILNNKSRIESLFYSRLIEEEERRMEERAERASQFLFSRTL